MSTDIISDYGGNIHKKCPICNKPFDEHLPWELIRCDEIYKGANQ